MKNIHLGKIKGTKVILADKIRGIDTILEEGTLPKTGSQDLLVVAEQICSVMILMDHPSSLIGTVGGLREMTVIGRVLKILMDRLGNHMVMAEGPEETTVMDHPGSLMGMVGGLEEMTAIGRDLKILMDHLNDHIVMVEGPVEATAMDHPGSLMGMIEDLKEMTVDGRDLKTGRIAQDG